MKTHFIKMFNYDRFANDLILNAIFEANEPQKPVQLLSHLLASQKVWLNRCKVQPHSFSNPWPEFSAAQCAELIEQYHQDWVSYLEEFSDNDFSHIVSYQNFRGDHHQDQLSDIIAHVINHGTHTRAQAGQQLKLAGVQSLPITDYSYYLRVLKGNI